MTYFTLFLALIWGGVWAAFLQFVPLGRFLAQKRTWITVVVGVGGDLLIASLVVPWDVWKWFALIVACSSLGIIARSLFNEWDEWKGILYAYKDAAGKQDDLGS